MSRSCRRIITKTLRRDIRKTILSAAMIDALRRQGLAVDPFKKRPGCMDAARIPDAYLAETAGRSGESKMNQPSMDSGDPSDISFEKQLGMWIKDN